ncbi:porin family protein [Alteromonas sp. BL110]|uniref:outer membrane beta-barrel protein n=1 Tax=Alteromonas sp. BL110 TaxID=1714845 RepID=UPI000E4CBCAD|nr:outer membrane beta-barrel protein [Alteromonas sp. BL110]AXT40165.1 porin family protein [Alteromonas sp. BL110]RKM79396.1 porin family protein [Alteromonas sp. BL110]
MFKKALLTAALVSVSMSASANWVLGVGYSNLSDSEGDVDISLGAIVASAGYAYAVNENFTLVPELRYGIGVSDDEIFGVDIELDSFYALSLKGEFNVSDNVYAYIAPSYGKLEMTASAGGFSESDTSDWEFGFGGGLGYKFNPTTSIEASYESFDGADVLSLGAKFAF